MKIEDIFPVMYSQIAEAFSSNYSIEPAGVNGTTRKYRFETDRGVPYFIYIEQVELNPVAKDFYERSFGVRLADDIPDGLDYSFYIDKEGQMLMRYDRTGEITRNSDDNTMKIFSTAMNFAKVFLNKSGASFMAFEGEKELGGLYKNMLRRYLPPEYEAFEQKSGTQTKFLIVKEEYVL